MDLVWFWLVAGLIGVLGGAYLWRPSVDLSARAQGEPDGSWAAACGIQVGPFTATAVTASGVPLTVVVQVFKWRLRQGKPRKSAPVPRERALRTAVANAESWLDPGGAVAAFFREPRPLGLRFLRVDLSYSFRDAALTGRLLGAVYALTGVLPSKVVVRQHPRWDFDDRWAVEVEARLVTRPGPLLVRLLWTVVENKLGRRRSRSRPRELTSP